MKSKENKIIKIKHKYSFTFVTFIFLLILVYILYQIIHSIIQKPIQVYNVETPSYDYVSQYYNGIILRDETSIYASSDGFITYYISNEEYVRKDTLIFTTDKTNEFESRITSAFADSSSLSKTSLLTIQKTLSNSIKNYNPLEFDSVSSSVTDIKAEIINSFLSDATDKLNSFDLSGYEPFYAGSIGFVSLYQDSYDGITANQLSSAHFNHQNYEKKSYRSGNFIRTGDFVCKFVKDNTFSVAFPLNDFTKGALRGKDQISIHTQDGLLMTGNYSETVGNDGNPIGVISFQKYGVNYLGNRFVSFQIVDTTQKQQGYKIPLSSVVTKSFYVIDSSYLTQGGDNKGVGVYLKEGDSVTFVNVQKYGESDGSAYIIGKNLYDGAILQKPLTMDTIKLGIKTQLEGVYQINQGYCVFKQIERIGDSMDTSYLLIKSKTPYGIGDFERIVIDGSSVNENEIIYQ